MFLMFLIVYLSLLSVSSLYSMWETLGDFGRLWETLGES